MMGVSERVRGRSRARTLLALLYGAAGALHLLLPAPLLSITPDWVPQPERAIALTGAAELLGALGLLQPYSQSLRKWAGCSLALYALCVWPANLHHMQIDLAKPDDGLGLVYHIPRLLAQPLIIWWALWSSRVLDWPWSRD
jgi:uncharacterized membrane protein